MKFIRNFAADLDTLLVNADRGEHFAFARFNTGEMPMLRNLPAQGRGSGWKADPKKNQVYYQAMQAAWNCQRPDWYVGVSCPCCNPPEHRWYMGNLKVKPDHATFATLFMGSNWQRTLRWLHDNREKYVLVSPKHGDFEVPADCFKENWDWVKLREMLKDTVNHHPVVFAAGPLGKILCHQLLPYTGGALLDIGSALDLDIWGKPTRCYLARPLKQKLKSKKARKENDRRKRLWNRTCVWKLSKRPVHKG